MMVRLFFYVKLAVLSSSAFAVENQAAMPHESLSNDSPAVPVTLDNVSSTGQVTCHSLPASRLEYASQLTNEAFLNQRFSQFQGQKIGDVEFIRLDVFDTDDPSENNPLYRFLNSLNMRTREATIRNHLLFDLGEPLDPVKVEETERNLRSLSYLSDAFIMPTAICGDRVHLAVVVKDAWTTQPIISGSLQGGETKSRIGFTEGNFLGTGSEVSIILTQDEQRNLLSYRFKKDYLFNKPLSVDLKFSDSDDGYVRGVSFGKPFYTDDTPVSYGVSLNQSKLRQTFKQNKQAFSAYDIESDQRSLFLSWKIPSGTSSILRSYVGATYSDQKYRDFALIAPGKLTQQGTVEPRQTDILRYPWLAVEYRSRDYRTLSNIDYINTVEDINLGLNAFMSIGYSPSSPSRQAAVINEMRYSYRWLWSQHLGTISANLANVRYDENRGNHYNAGFDIDYRFLMTERQRIAFQSFYRQAKPQGLHDAIRVGGFNGLRGYPANFALGDRSVGATLEYRYHSGLHWLNILRIGFAAYIDAAALKNDTFALDNDGYDGDLLSNAGVGLRLASSKTHVGNVIHIDIASPIGDNFGVDSFQILLRAENRF